MGEPSFVEAGSTRTFYLESGTGGDVVLLLHGSGPGVSGTLNWRLALPALAADFRVLCPDLVGFGRTVTTDPVVTSLDMWVDQVIALLDGLGVERVHVVGNSMGGAVALGLAARHPDRVGRLVLMGTVGIAFPITDALDAVWGYEPDLDRMRELIALFAADDRFAHDDELVRLRFEASAEPSAHARYASLFPPPRQRWVDAVALDVAELQRIHHPVLLVHGKQDRVVPWQATSLRLLDVLPDARLHLFPRCGHWVQIERSNEFHQLVRGFLRMEAD